MDWLLKTWWESLKKAVGNDCFTHKIVDGLKNPQSFTNDLHLVFSIVLHWISTLAINLLLDFFDLVAEDKVEFKFVFDFFNTVHNGGVVLYTYLGGDFIGA